MLRWHAARQVMSPCDILLQAAGQDHAWTNAADAVKDDAALYQRLFRNFTRLGSSAQKYAQSRASGGWNHARSALRKTTDEASALRLPDLPCCRLCTTTSALINVPHHQRGTTPPQLPSLSEGSMSGVCTSSTFLKYRGSAGWRVKAASIKSRTCRWPS